VWPERGCFDGLLIDVDLETSDLDFAAALLTSGAELVRVRESADGARWFVFRREREITAEIKAGSELNRRARRLLARLHPYLSLESRR
jgi:hypothetical protein